MAVIAMWQCDKDGSMFTDKKLADEHDKMLELAEAIGEFLGKEVAGLDESQLENIGIVLARNKDLLVKACKGKPDALLEATEQADASSDSDESENNLSIAEEPASVPKLKAL